MKKVKKKCILYIHLVEKEQLKDKEKYMEISSSQIKSVAQFRHVLEDYYKNDNLKKLILKYDARNAKNINFIINEINIFINNKFNENDKKFVFIVSIERNFNKDEKRRTRKIKNCIYY